MWRLAKSSDSEAIIEMCRELNREDPGVRPVPDAHMIRTLTVLHAQPVRGRPLALEIHAQVQGYALLITFWSNELGGEICTIDELYVRPDFRGQGHASALITALTGDRLFGTSESVAIDLEVTPKNQRAKTLYAKLGFLPAPNERLRYRRG